MRKVLILSLMFCVLVFSSNGQTIKGPVLKKELVGKYEGALKKGLANGKGMAIGQDTYKGDFKDGLPDGAGIYTDSLGNVFKGTFKFGLKEGKGEFIPAPSSNDKVMTGYWMNDKYVGNERVDPYEILNTVGTVSPRIYSTGPGNVIVINVVDPVDNANIAANIQLIGRGSPRTDSSYNRYFFDDVQFPVEFYISYTTRTKLGGISGNQATADNSIRLKINKPGNWSITLKN